MQRCALGKTGLDVSIVSYGCIKLPQIDEELAAECLNLGLDLGINFIDTARNYRDSEEKIGKGIGHRRDEFYLATKTTARDADGLTSELDTSLQNLQTDYLDLYQLHSVSDPDTWERVTAPGGALEGARKAQDEGKVRHVGVTIHRSLTVMRDAIESGEFETIMLAYSPLDPEAVADEILPLAKECGLGVIIMKALSGGALSMPEEQRPAEGDPIVRGSLRYVLGNDAVSCVIPGMRAIREVRENCAIGERFVPLADEEQRELFARLGALSGKFRYDQFSLGCGYCLPCPNDVPIPEVFRALTMYRAYPEHLRHLGLDLYQSLDVTPDACTECRECVEKCPGGLDIPARLQEAMEELENPAPSTRP
jgi:predicted aldo/keto reductase-like oxidoreductase